MFSPPFIKHSNRFAKDMESKYSGAGEVKPLNVKHYIYIYFQPVTSCKSITTNPTDNCIWTPECNHELPFYQKLLKRKARLISIL